MTTIQQIQQDDAGTRLRGTIRDQDDAIVDIGAATTLECQVRIPGNRTPELYTATLVGDGSDGQIEYKKQAADFLTGGARYLGVHEYRFRVAFANGDAYTSITWESFEVVE